MSNKNRPYNVIIVEEDDLLIDVYKTIINQSDKNITFEIFKNPDEALKRVTRNNFDLMITNYKFNKSKNTGLDIARLVYPLGKHTIIITRHKLKVKLYLSLIYYDMKNMISVFRKPFKCYKLQKEINKCIKKCIPLEDMFSKIYEELKTQTGSTKL